MKDTRKPLWMIEALIVALAWSVIACSGEKATPAAATVAPEGTRQPSIIPLGRTATSDAGQVTVVGVRRSDREQAESPPGGSEWLLVELDVRNASAESWTLTVRLMDLDGAGFERAYPPGTDPELDAPIAAGIQLRGEIAFLVPAGMQGGALIYGPGDERWALQLGSVRNQE